MHFAESSIFLPKEAVITGSEPACEHSSHVFLSEKSALLCLRFQEIGPRLGDAAARWPAGAFVNCAGRDARTAAALCDARDCGDKPMPKGGMGGRQYGFHVLRRGFATQEPLDDEALHQHGEQTGKTGRKVVLSRDSSTGIGCIIVNGEI
jgi:hypothetical protein